MENFDWTEFTLKIAIKSTVSTIYDAWTKASEIEKWFLSNAAFSNVQAAVAKNDSIQKEFSYAWQWFLYPVTETGKITDANGQDFLQFTFAGNCLVDIRLIQKDDYVLVALTQKNIPTDDKSKKNIRLDCHSGWSFYLVNLKSVYEGGLDLRNKNPEFPPPMVNT